MSRRVYKFLSARYALDALERRRIKISTLEELNDPFDLVPVNITRPEVEEAVTRVCQWFRDTNGLLCFSRNWDNILLWSHYGCSHTGVCLGFDIPDAQPGESYGSEVSYRPSVLTIENPEDVNYEFAYKLLRTKHEVWSYEQEIRLFIQMNDPPDENGLRWFDFSESLNLKEVIVGVHCTPVDSRKVVHFRERYDDKVEFSWAGLQKDAFALLRMTSPPPWQI